MQGAVKGAVAGAVQGAPDHWAVSGCCPGMFAIGRCQGAVQGAVQGCCSRCSGSGLSPFVSLLLDFVSS